MTTGPETNEFEQKGSIDRVHSVVVTRSSREPIFLGLTRENMPLSTSNFNDLNPSAKRSVLNAQTAGIKIQEVEYRNVKPVLYTAMRDPIDMMDQGDNKVQDLLNIQTIDGEGKREQITIPELIVLDGISNGVRVWQDSAVTNRADSITARQMYTLFLKDIDPSTRSQALAVMFPADTEGSSEFRFKAFVLNTLKKLSALEEMQPDNKKKGYIEVVKNASRRQRRSILSYFIDTGENRDESDKSLKERLLEIGQDFYLIEPDITDFSIEKMSTEKLIELASQFRRIAQRTYGRSF